MKEWMNQTWWLYDLTVIAIAVLCIWGGWKRGLLRTVAGLLGYVSAGLLAGLLAQPAAAYVYDRWVEPACTQVVEQQLAKYQMSDSLRGLLSNYGIQLDTGLLEQVASDSNTAADQLYGTLSSQTGVPAELLQSGVLIRHLILPGWTDNSIGCIDFVANSFPAGSVLFSLMSQYTPMPGVGERFPELARVVDPAIAQMLYEYLLDRGIEDGYYQEPDSSGDEMIPEWDLTGLGL